MPTRENKYHAIKAYGHASTKEHRRAVRLRVLERAGLIRDLRGQVTYELIPAQRDSNGKIIERACKYIADFVYFDCEKGKEVVEDTKGFRTKEYNIKRKLMLWVHGIRIQEI